MTRCVIYLDESGDLGFKFDAPYRASGSSRHLTLGAVICVDNSNRHIKRFMRQFYRTRMVPAGGELKWADLNADNRMDFAIRAAKLVSSRRELGLATITVNKQRVMPHIRADANKLYNYMTGLLLLKTMTRFESVLLIPDARSIKVESGNSLHDYLQVKLWFDEGVATQLETTPMPSTNCRPLHFTDFLCGAFQSKHEDAARGPSGILGPFVSSQNLFF